MNNLAHVVHALVSGEEPAGLATLPQTEKAALAALSSLLRRAPQDLALFLAQEDPANTWYSPPPIANELA